MRTLKYVDLKSLRKGILGHLTSQIPVSLFGCFLPACLLFCFIVCFIANALKSGHCVICIRPVGRFFLFARGVGGGVGFDPTTRRTKRAPGVL